MLMHLPLRLRILLLFALLMVASIAVVAAALFFGYRSTLTGSPANGFILAAVISAFGLMAASVAVWLLFDENVAKPIDKLAASMRVRAHAGVQADLDKHAARYLGDLAPAAEAVSVQLDRKTLDTAELVAFETQRLDQDRARLANLLTEIPVAIVIVGPSHQIVLYDGQAAQVLAQIAPPRLNASLFDYIDKECLLAAHARLLETESEQVFQARGSHGNFAFDARIKPLGYAPGYMLVINDAQVLIEPDAARPLTYDFELLEKQAHGDFWQTPLSDISFVVFDCETTGLLPHKDEVVQLGATRVVRGGIVEGEILNQLVNPGRPIPPASTKVHHISDDMVADAPGIHTVAMEFHHFARDAVIVAHNAPFDMAFLRRHAKDMDITWDHPILDTVLLSAVLFGITESHTLDSLCSRLGVTIPEALRHTALGDARATAEVLCLMLPMLTSRGFVTLGDVIEQTRKHSRLIEDLN